MPASSTATTATFSWAQPTTGDTDSFVYTVSDLNGVVYGTNILTTTFTATNLLPSTTYNFIISALSNYGVGGSSLPVTITTQATIGGAIAPSVPINVFPSTINLNDITLTWTPSTGTQPITYQVQYRAHGTTAWTSAFTQATTAAYNLFGLVPGVSYDLQVNASNLAGTSVYSTIITATTYTGVNLPLAVIPVLGTPIGTLTGSSMPVSWVFGTPSATYNVYFGLSQSAMTLFAMTSNTQTTVTGLAASTTYQFRVDAVNTGGVSPSLYVTGTTGIDSVLRPPSTPTGLVTVPLTSGTDVLANWTASTIGSLPLTYSLRYRLKGTGTGSTGSPQMIPTGYVSTFGNQFVDTNGNYVRIAAANWSGAELGQWVPGQLWMRSYITQMNAAKALGINTLRFMYSDYMVLLNPTPFYSTTDQFSSSGIYCINTTLNPTLAGLTTLQCWDVLVTYAGSIGLKIIFSKCSNEAGPYSGSNTHSGKWYGDTGNSGKFYNSQECINVQTILAARYAGNSTVIGLEINNECIWDGGVQYCGFNTADATNDICKFWRDCGNAIGQVNPNILVICQSPRGPINTQDYQSAIGQCSPLPVLNIPNRLVISTHSFPAVVAGYSDVTSGTQNYSYGSIFSNNICPVWISSCGFPNDFTKTGNGSGADSTGCAAWKTAIFGTTGYTNTIAGIPLNGYGLSWCWNAINPSGANSGLAENTDAGFSLLAYSDGVTALTTPVSYCTPIMFYGQGSGSNPWVLGPTGLANTFGTISSLTASTTYDVQVAGVNSVVQSPWSLLSTSTTTTAPTAAFYASFLNYKSSAFMSVPPNPITSSTVIRFATNATIPLPPSNGSSWSTHASAIATSGFSGAFNYQGIGFGNGSAIVVGTNGAISLTTDGMSWSNYWSVLPVNQTQARIVYANGTWMAVGGSSTVLYTSPTGATWTTRTLPSTSGWLSIAYGNSTWVALSNSAAAAYSTDNGVTWTSTTMPSSAGWQDVKYGQGLFVATQVSGTSAYATSPDGITWTGRTMPVSTGFYNLQFGNGIFVTLVNSGPTALVSTNGTSWTSNAMIAQPAGYSGAAYQGFTFGDGLFVATGLGDVAVTSPDGVTWTQYTMPTGAGAESTLLTCNGSAFFGVGVGTSTVVTSP